MIHFRQFQLWQSISLAFIFALGLLPDTQAQDRPNILWLVVEDTSPYLFPAYGNDLIKTPNLDSLAQHGVVFTNAFAPGPQCSPARSSLISGSDATTYGTDFHREGRPVPDHYFFPTYLRESGYYTTNIGKTDYNIPRDKEAELLQPVWNKNGAGATYNATEREDRPFFAQFNNMTTHMSRMTTVTLDVREPVSVNVDSKDLPPYVPNLPESRADYALHLEGVQNADRWVGLFLDDLRKRKLMENTIIFFFSDHGGSLPRGKAFPFDTGHRAALIAYVPKRWQHLWDEQPGTRTDRLVSFVDFGPTALSLAGVEPPEHMQGKPFMGKYRQSPREYAYTFRTNTGPHFDPSRSVYDGRYHYIRYYTPYKVHALRQSFQFGMPAQLAWDKQFHAGESASEHQQYYEPKSHEMLFDLQDDPWEMKNLAKDPAYQNKLTELQAAHNKHVQETQDIGFIPQEIRRALVSSGGNLYDNVRATNYPLDDLHQLAAQASDPERVNGDALAPFLTHKLASMRFWAASGFAYLYSLGQKYPVPPTLRALMEDKHPAVAATAAEALVYAGEEKSGTDKLISMAVERTGEAISALEEIQHQYKLSKKQVQKIKAAALKPSQDSENTFGLRSLLVEAGALPLDSLYTPAERKSFLEGYHDRITQWAPTRPNPDQPLPAEAGLDKNKP